MQQTGKTVQDKRHYGIDLLRIVSMVMVCVLHVNLFCQYHRISWRHEPLTWLSWTGMEAMCIVAVNLYAMITGYVCICSKWRPARYAALWLQVAFYTVAFYLAGYALSEAGVIPALPKGKILRALLVVPLAGPYWYFVAYTGLFLLIPFLNSFLLRLHRRAFNRLLMILFVVFPYMNLMGASIYDSGYNMIWLSALYVIGAYMRLYPIRMSSFPCIAVFLLSAAGTCLISLSPKNGMSYAMPFNITGAVALFLFFQRQTIPNEKARKLIRMVSPLSFGIYLVQCHPIVWGMLGSLGEKAVSVFQHPVWLLFSASICLFVACMAIDWMRQLLFRVAQADAVSRRLVGFMTYAWRAVKQKAVSMANHNGPE